MFFFHGKLRAEGKIRNAVLVQNVAAADFSVVFREVKPQVAFPQAVIRFSLSGKSSVFAFVLTKLFRRNRAERVHQRHLIQGGKLVQLRHCLIAETEFVHIFTIVGIRLNYASKKKERDSRSFFFSARERFHSRSMSGTNFRIFSPV